MSRHGIELDEEDIAVIANALSAQMEAMTDFARAGETRVYDEASKVLRKIQAFAEEHDISLYGRRRRGRAR